jgi:SagB-type dehydrogenase family enzyme
MRTLTPFGAETSLALDYHMESRNRGGLKANVRAHLHNYSEGVQRLVASGSSFAVAGQFMALPAPRAKPVMSLDEAITARRSRRDFGAPLELEEVSTLLHLACGTRSPAAHGIEACARRPAASSGGLSSIQAYVLIQRVEKVEPGVYHYDARAHGLRLVRSGDFRTFLATKVFYQSEFAEAAMQIALVCSIDRLMEKYGSRGYRLGLLDAGHASQTLYLAAAALGLNACACAGFIDDQIDHAIGIDGITASTLLMMIVGKSLPTPV